MKEIDVKVEKWQSDDGKIFATKDDCMIYEAGRGYVGRWFQNLADPERTEVWCIAGATTWYSTSETGMEEVTAVRPAICQYGFGDTDVWQEDLTTFQELNEMIDAGKIVEIDQLKARELLLDIATKEIDDKLCLMTESDNGSVDEDKDLESIIGCALDIFVKTLQGEDD